MKEQNYAQTWFDPFTRLILAYMPSPVLLSLFVSVGVFIFSYDYIDMVCAVYPALGITQPLVTERGRTVALSIPHPPIVETGPFDSPFQELSTFAKASAYAGPAAKRGHHVCACFGA